ncbi:hypothetical protein ACA910_022740 [Epithemia clementina (nom. ined.)]
MVKPASQTATSSATGRGINKRRRALGGTTFRLTRHLEIELISTLFEGDDDNCDDGNNAGTTAMEYWNDGSLRSIGFFNFTGRLVLHREAVDSAEKEEVNEEEAVVPVAQTMVAADVDEEDGNGKREVLAASTSVSLMSSTWNSNKRNHTHDLDDDDENGSGSVLVSCGSLSKPNSTVTWRPSLDQNGTAIKPILPLHTPTRQSAGRKQPQGRIQLSHDENKNDDDTGPVFSQALGSPDSGACRTTTVRSTREQTSAIPQQQHVQVKPEASWNNNFNASETNNSRLPQPDRAMRILNLDEKKKQLHRSTNIPSNIVETMSSHEEGQEAEITLKVRTDAEIPSDLGREEETGSSCSDHEEDAFANDFQRYLPVLPLTAAANITTAIRPPRRATLTNSTNTTPRLRRNLGVLRKVWTFAHHKQESREGFKTIPESIRSRRHNLRFCSPISGSTPLHKLCALPRVTLEELMECANRYPKAISTLDSLGRYPLHILADNEVLILSSLVSVPSSGQRDAASIFCGHMINEFPQATITPDHDGFVPFARILADWIDWACDFSDTPPAPQHEQQSVGLRDENVSGLTNDADNNNNNNLRSNTNGIGLKKGYYSARKGVFMGGGLLSSFDTRELQNDHDAPATSKPNYYWPLTRFERKMFPRVEVWEEVEWCLSMLSNVLDVLSRHSSMHDANMNNYPPPAKRRQTVAASATDITVASNDSHHLPPQQQPRKKTKVPIDDRKVLAEALVEKLPSLLPTVLLVDDDGMNTRERLLEMKIIRRLFLCQQTVGMWLIEMLNHGGSPATRAVDYLWLVSSVSIEDYTGSYGSVHSTELEAFNTDRHNVFEAVGSLKGTIASLVTLDTTETDRAASTAVIWHTMNQKLSRPFVLGLVLIDLLLHITLMGAFRPIATPKSELSGLGVYPSTVIFVILAHYFLRKSCEAWVLLSVSPLVLRAYFSNMWTIFDTFATILTLWATIWHNNSGGAGVYHTGLNTLVAGILWLKVLGFLKVVNKEMSTFIIALSQILYDIRLFMVVLVVCVIMFGDMFFIAVSTKDDGRFCINKEQYTEETGNSSDDDFCTSAFDSYLQVYSLLLGNFSLENMTETTSTTILFIIFTVFGVIIMLNVLIAIISDSYEKATMSGSLLFGRARVLYVAQNEALERFLQPRGRAGLSSPYAPTVGEHSFRRKARQTTRWTVLLAILASAILALLYLIGLLITYSLNQLWWSFCATMCMVLVLSCALWVVGTFILDGILRDLLPNRAERVYDAIGRINNWIVSRISNFLFGLDKEKIKRMGSNGTVDDDWNGRVKYLESVLERMIAESKMELRSEMLEMKAEVHEIHEHIAAVHE